MLTYNCIRRMVGAEDVTMLTESQVHDILHWLEVHQEETKSLWKHFSEILDREEE